MMKTEYLAKKSRFLKNPEGKYIKKGGGEKIRI